MSSEMSSQNLVSNMTGVQLERAERVSALLDGELADARTPQLISEVARDDVASLQWARYQSIGDMLRSAELAPTSRDDTFMTRMRLSLAAEPVVIAPASHASLGTKIPVSQPGSLPQQVASVLSWKNVAMVGGAAGLLLAAAMGMKGFGNKPTSQTPALEVSQTQRDTSIVKAATSTDASLVVVQTANGAVIRDARLDQYFAAHSGMRSGTGLGNGASMAAPAAFVRSASVDSAAQQ
jgi:sigma-E factor negative regulatory protein RseA